MKNYKINLLILLGILVLSSCEKVIDIELNEADQRIIIEAPLKEGTSIFSVSVTKSAPYFEASSPEGIDDAIVNLSYDDTVVAIPSVGNGVYAASVTATANKEYMLSVEVNEVLYEAISYLKPKVNLTEIYSEFQPAQGPFQEGNVVYFRYQDPAGEPNFYRVLHYVDGVAQLEGGDLQLLNDNVNDGGDVRFQLFQQIFESGDSVNLELIHFDEASYNYFTSLGDIIGGGAGPNSGSAAPGNPITNFNNNALGYFSTYSCDTLSLVIP